MLTLADTPTCFYAITDTHRCLFDSNAFYLLLIYQTATPHAIIICKNAPQLSPWGVEFVKSMT